MKRAILILVVGAFAAVVAYCAVFYSTTASQRQASATSAPELTWLKQEFNLSDAQFERISNLHSAYQPHCKEMCRRIDQQNARLRSLVSASTGMTTEIEAALAESARLRVECQAAMLNHFYDVSRNMSPAQAKRYLAWVQEKTFVPAPGTRIHENRR
ncbi:MAG: periplasmic heavy metal sensor [Verrucomicrobia subdivision 3 bacterium]|nr:periplasmic heavy metal sensor [Limisphaerales bacterium]